MDETLILTVAVRKGDGAVFHLDKHPKKVIERLAEPGDGKWALLIRQMKKHGKPCKVRLIIGYSDPQKTQPIFEGLTYRPKPTRAPVVYKATRPTPQRLE